MLNTPGRRGIPLQSGSSGNVHLDDHDHDHFKLRYIHDCRDVANYQLHDKYYDDHDHVNNHLGIADADVPESPSRFLLDAQFCPPNQHGRLRRLLQQELRSAR